MEGLGKKEKGLTDMNSVVTVVGGQYKGPKWYGKKLQ